MEKNVAGKWIVFAYGNPSHASAGLPITGDAANITANIRIDGGAANAVDDVNPTELEDGYYVFDVTATETNGDLLSFHPASATANVLVIGVPGSVWTRPANFNDLSITATTGRMDVDSVAGTAQTANDNGADINTLLTRIVGTLAAGTHNPATAAQIAVLSDWIDGGRLDLLLDAIKVVTDAQAATGTGLSAIPWNAAWDAEVQSEVNDGLVAFFTSPATLVALFWNEVLSKASYNVGQSGAKMLRLISDLVQLDGAISDAGPTTTDFDTNLTGYGDGYFEDAQLQFVNGSANAGLSKPISGYTSATGNFQFTAPDDWPVTPVNTDDFNIVGLHVHPISQIQSGLATTAELDKVPKSDGTVSHNATALAAITADVVGDAVIAELTTQGDTNETKIDTVDGVVDAILAMLDDPRAEPGQGAPAVNADLATKIDYLYKWTRNKKDNDGSTTNFYDDVGTTVDHKQTTSSAAGTVTKGEISAGP